MTLEEATQISHEVVANVYEGDIFKRAQAVQLGIEALKRIQDARDIEPESPAADLLPGETEE